MREQVTASPPTAALRLNVDITRVAGVIPAVIGFHPTDSIVVIPLTGQGQRRRVGVMMRMDLAELRTPADVLQLGRHCGGSPAVVAIYGGPLQVAEPALRVWLGVDVLDVLYLPNAGADVDPEAAAAFVLAGRAVLPDRAAVCASVDYRPDASTAATRFTAARLTTVGRRDGYLMARISTAADAVSELVAAAQAARDTDRGTAHLCAALAVLAYRTGDSVLARAAADRALYVDPAENLARLMLELISAAIPPHHLDVIVHSS